MPSSPAELRSDFWRALADASAAHAIMLRDASVIGDGTLESLVSAIDNARGSAPPELPAVLLAGKLDDRIDAGTSAGAAGAAQLGRAQMDLTATAFRMVVRRWLLSSLDQLDALGAELEAFAGAHAVTLMPVHVNGVPMHPSTLGHLASGTIASLERGRGALLEALSTVNRSPLGAGAMTGSGIPIDAARSAELLGFGAAIEQTVEALGGIDDVLAVAHAVESTAAGIVRWLNALLAIASSDPAFLSLDSSWTASDWAAPQWSGFGGVAALSAHGRKVAGTARSLAAMATELPFGPVAAETGILLSTIDDALSGLNVLTERTTALHRDALIVNRAALANRAGRAYVTSADLAEFLIIEESIEPAPARAIAGIVLNRVRETGLEISAITTEMIDTAALMVIGREVKVEFEAISRYLAPRRFIERRNLSGGPAPSAVRSWLAGAEVRRKADAERVAEIERRIEEAGKERGGQP